MWDVILDALLDSLKLLPFLLVIYLLIELIEKSDKARNKTVALLNGKLSPLAASAVGIVPQCGFSVMAANLYTSNYIKTGTLLAVLIATSDEALPIMIANLSVFNTLWIFVLIKMLYGMIVGFAVNLFDNRLLSVEADVSTEKGCCNHDIERHESGFWHFVKHPLKHTAKIFAYVLIINLLFGFLIYGVGEDSISAFMLTAKWFQPLVVTLVGLIPNCASSVLITNLYVDGLLTFSATVAGLCANSGIALAVLLKDRKNIKRNLAVLGMMFVFSVALGYVIMIIGY